MCRTGVVATGAAAVAVVTESGSGCAPRAAGACGVNPYTSRTMRRTGMAKYRASSLRSVELHSALPLVELIQYPVYQMQMPGDLRLQTLR